MKHRMPDERSSEKMAIKEHTTTEDLLEGLAITAQELWHALDCIVEYSLRKLHLQAGEDKLGGREMTAAATRMLEYGERFLESNHETIWQTLHDHKQWEQVRLMEQESRETRQNWKPPAFGDWGHPVISVSSHLTEAEKLQVTDEMVEQYVRSRENRIYRWDFVIDAERSEVLVMHDEGWCYANIVQEDESTYAVTDHHAFVLEHKKVEPSFAACWVCTGSADLCCECNRPFEPIEEESICQPCFDEKVNKDG